MSAVEVGRLLGPVDGEVDLADLLECFGGVLEPGGDLPVAGVGADDRVDVVVEHRETGSGPTVTTLPAPSSAWSASR